jgi:hypothetical protein
MDASPTTVELHRRRRAAKISAPAHLAAGEDDGILRSIRRPGVNLAVWRRPLPRPIARFARACLSAGDLHVGFDVAANEVALALAETVDIAGTWAQDRRAWIEDVGQLARRFADVTGARDVHVHAEILAHDSCRLFHVDNVRCRLITTYAGPGTQWLADADVIRPALGDNDAAIRTGAPVQRLRTGWIGLFKGERQRGMEGRGIVHRSAPIRGTGQRRLVVKIDYAREIAC